MNVLLLMRFFVDSHRTRLLYDYVVFINVRYLPVTSPPSLVVVSQVSLFFGMFGLLLFFEFFVGS